MEKLPLCKQAISAYENFMPQLIVPFIELTNEERSYYENLRNEGYQIRGMLQQAKASLVPTSKKLPDYDERFDNLDNYIADIEERINMINEYLLTSH